MGSRLLRKNRVSKDLNLVSSGGVYDLFDNMFKEIYRINDEEYDNLCENATDAELHILVNENVTSFSDLRQIINTINKLVS